MELVRRRGRLAVGRGLLVVEPATADRKPAASPHKFHE